ncbi:MAG: hypothetical protein Q6361_01580, partial [Candidatus Hermodarchaeota archaeon]|nr:hypothetical protein [Candidatus Hermodarchaeota archaeon]
METFDVGKLLTRIGILLLLIAGIVQAAEWGYFNIGDLINYGQLYTYPIMVLAAGIVAIVFAILLFIVFLPMADKNPTNGGIFIIVFGIIAAIFAFEWAIIGAPGAI